MLRVYESVYLIPSLNYFGMRSEAIFDGKK